MKKGINIVVDVLINSIRNVTSRDVFDTKVVKINKGDFLLIEKGWAFDWIKESKNNDVYKLTTKDNPGVIQGLISLRDNSYHLYQSDRKPAFNIGKNKVYEAVAGNLFAFACKFSFDKGYLGDVSFVATNLISHYENSIGAKRFGSSNVMALDYFAAKQLIQKYFKE